VTIVLVQQALFVTAMIALFWSDLRERRLPNAITLPGIVAGLLFSFFAPPGWRQSVIGILLGAGGSWIMAEAWSRWRHEEGMGMGDVKMLAMIGAFLGWQILLAVFVFSTMAGSLMGMGLILLKRGTIKSALPFGCFLAVGGILGAFLGHDVVTWYLSLHS
jgi:leader peptidase (prepilin peptidase)/N-methyltransferase